MALVIPGIEEVTLEEVQAESTKRGLTPEKSAEVIRRWQNASLEFLREAVPTEKYVRASKVLVDPAEKAIQEAQKSAVAGWTATKLPELISDPERQKQFVALAQSGIPSEDDLKGKVDSDLAAAFRDLRGVVSNPAFAPSKLATNQTIESKAGAPLATWDALRKPDGSTEIQLQVPEEVVDRGVKIGDTIKDYTVTVPPVTEDDYNKALESAQKRYSALVAESRVSYEQGASRFGGRREPAVISRELDNAEAQLQALEKGYEAAKPMLTSEKLQETLKNPTNPLFEKLGKRNLLEDFTTGLVQGAFQMEIAASDFASVAVKALTLGAVPDVAGPVTTQLRESATDFQKQFPGSTAREFQGGSIAQDAISAFGAMIPALTTSGLTSKALEGFSAAAAKVGGMAAGVGAQAYGATYADMLNDADAAEAAGNTRLAKMLRDNARTAATLNGVAEMGTEMLFGEEIAALGLRTTQGGLFSKLASLADNPGVSGTFAKYGAGKTPSLLNRVTQNTLKSVLENSVEEAAAQVIQGGMISPALQGVDQGSAADVGRAALIGGIIGTPMGVASAVRAPNEQAEIAQGRLSAMNEQAQRLQNELVVLRGGMEGAPQQVDAETVQEKELMLNLTNERRRFWATELVKSTAQVARDSAPPGAPPEEVEVAARSAAGGAMLSNVPTGTPIEAVQAAVNEVLTQPENQNATQEGIIPQNDQQQYPQAVQGGPQAPQAGSGNSSVQGGQVAPQTQTEVANVPVTPQAPVSPAEGPGQVAPQTEGLSQAPEAGAPVATSPQPAPVSEVTAAVDELNRIHRASLRAVPPPSTGLGRMAQEIRQLSGRQLIFVEGQSRFDGVQRGNNLFVKVNGGQVLRNVIGEELGHSLESLPGYGKLVQLLRERNPEKYGEYQDALLELEYAPDQVEREFVANVIGEAVADRAFWRKLAQTTDPTVLQRMYDTLATLIDKILAIARGQTGQRPVASTALTNLEKAREAVRELLLSSGNVAGTGTAQSRSVVTPSQDAAYLAAVESGDMETAQRMVDEAAKAAGYDVGPVYHGTRKQFDVFTASNTDRKSYTNWETGEFYATPDKVFFFTEKPLLAAAYGPRTISAYLKIENPKQGGRVDAMGFKAAAFTSDLINVGESDGMITGPMIDLPSKDATELGKLMEQSSDVRDEANQAYKGKIYAVFNANQIKSADPVTRDADGNVIPLSQRFNPETANINYSRSRRSVTPSQDAAYLAAVEADDMETVQRMVDAAARAAGYDRAGMHGTNAHAYSPGESITVFNTRPMSGRGAAFFTSSSNLAKEYGEKIYRTYLKLVNPLAVDVDGQHWSNISPSTKVNANVTDELAAKKKKNSEGLNKIFLELFGDTPSAFDPSKIDLKELSDVTGEGGHMETDQIVKKARSLGYDGVVFKGVKDSPTAGSLYAHEPSDVFAVFNPNQIKSADPVTRDEAGNIIPLSQRFNPETDNINYSRSRKGMQGPLYDTVTHRRASTGAEYEVTEWKDLEAVVQPILDAEKITRDNGKAQVQLMRSLQTNERRITDQLTRGIERQFAGRLKRIAADYATEEQKREAVNREKDVLRALVKQRMIAFAGNTGASLLKRPGKESRRLGTLLSLEAQKAAFNTKSEVTANPHTAARILQSVGHGWGDDLAELMANIYQGKSEFFKKTTKMSDAERAEVEAATKTPAAVYEEVAQEATPAGRTVNRTKAKVISAMRALYKRITGQESRSQANVDELLRLLESLETNYHGNVDQYLEMASEAIDNLNPENQASAIKALTEAAQFDIDLLDQEQKLLGKDRDFIRATERFIEKVSNAGVKAKTQRKEASQGTKDLSAIRQAALEGKMTPEQAGDMFVQLGGSETRRAAFVEAVSQDLATLKNQQAEAEVVSAEAKAARQKTRATIRGFEKLGVGETFAQLTERLGSPDAAQAYAEILVRQGIAGKIVQGAERAAEDFQRDLENRADKKAEKEIADIEKDIARSEEQAGASFKRWSERDAKRKAAAIEAAQKRLQGISDGLTAAAAAALEQATSPQGPRVNRPQTQLVSARAAANTYAKDGDIGEMEVRKELEGIGITGEALDTLMWSLTQARYGIRDIKEANNKEATSKTYSDIAQASIDRTLKRKKTAAAKPPTLEKLGKDAARTFASGGDVSESNLRDALTNAGIEDAEIEVIVEALWNARELAINEKQRKADEAVAKKETAAVDSLKESLDRIIAGPAPKTAPAEKSPQTTARQVARKFAAGDPGVSEGDVRDALAQTGMPQDQIDSFMERLLDARIKIAEDKRAAEDEAKKELAARVFDKGASAVPGGRKTSVEEDILSTITDNPEWEVSDAEGKRKIIEEVLVRRGFTPAEAAEGSAAALAAFEKRMTAIIQKTIARFGKKLKRGKVTDAELQRIVRLGVLDPANGLVDALAEAYGWKGLSALELEEVIALVEKAKGIVDPQVKLSLNLKAMELVEAATGIPPSFRNLVSANLRASSYGGFSSLFLQILATTNSLIYTPFRELLNRLVSTDTVKNPLSVFTAIAETATAVAKNLRKSYNSAKIAWSTGAGLFLPASADSVAQVAQGVLAVETLTQRINLAVRRMKDDSVSKGRKFYEAIPLIFAYLNRLTWKLNGFADSFNITQLQGFHTRVALWKDLRDQGVDPTAALNAFVASADAATNYGVAELGLSKAQAQKEAIARAEADLYDYLQTKGVSPSQRQMDGFREAVHLMGNHAEQQGALTKAAGKIVELGEMVPLGLGSLITGPIRIIANVAEANAWWMPVYGLIRYAREAAAQKEGKGTGKFTGRFHLSAKTPEQLIRRRNEAFFTNILYATAFLLLKGQPDEPEDRDIFITGGYPTDPNELAKFVERGYTPYTLYVGKGGKGNKRSYIQMTRGSFEFMNFPLLLAQRSADVAAGRMSARTASFRYAYDVASVALPSIENAWKTLEIAKRGNDDQIANDIARRLSPLLPLSALTRSLTKLDAQVSKDDTNFQMGQLIPITTLFQDNQLELRNALNENPFAEDSFFNKLARLGAPVGLFEERGVRDPVVAEDFQKMNYSPARLESLDVFNKRIAGREEELVTQNKVSSVQELYSLWIERRAANFKEIYQEAPDPGDGAVDQRTLDEIIADGDKDAYKDRMATWFALATRRTLEDLGIKEEQ